MVHLAQTVLLSCTDTSTISKQTETRFHRTHIIQQFHWVRPKKIMSLWYIWHIPCTYLASRLALSPNGPKRASTWASSSCSSIGCVQNDFWACGTFGANRAPILHLHKHCIQMDRNEIPHDPHHLGVLSGASKTISEPIVYSTQTVHLSCIRISTVSKWIETSFHLILVT